jgi:hypothetical protein
MVTALVLFTQVVWAQSGIKGVIKDAQMNDELIGATIMVEGTTNGAATDANGKFKLDISPGSYVVDISYVGYETQKVDVIVESGKYASIGNIKLEPNAIGIGGIQIVADRARERETPVAFSNIESKQLEEQLGSRDIPLIMNVTPSVYATQQGGGAGDARINVRGFNQRNVAIMLNGVPVNDMENGWVYWSNWDGIADATSSIQMQRGLSAVNLATPSIGGTMNVITSAAENKAGGSAKFEVGSGNFYKATFSGNSGLIKDKFAISVSAVRKVGQGVIDKTWTDAWAYYIGTSYNINKNNRIEAYFMGAPQRHGQNLYKQNIATYDSAYAKDLSGYDDQVSNSFVQQGRFYNQNWSPVDPGYSGNQYWAGKTKSRHGDDFINERENFYHKPLANLNWYAQFSEKVTMFTTLYYSGGVGGGTGTYGKLYRRDADGNLGDDDYKFYYGASPWSWDWNQTIAANSGTDDTVYIDKKPVARQMGQSVGILRNSRNDQWTIGGISKVRVQFTDALKTTFGVDLRKAKVEHYREVRDLLGGSYYIDNSNEFNPDNRAQLGDKIAYNFTNDIGWLGGFAQAEYTKGAVTAYGTVGYSMIKYTHTNHFKTTNELEDGSPDISSGELVLNTDWISGYQIKGGLSYRLNERFTVFGNGGLVSKVPIFDAVIDDFEGALIDNPLNEKFVSFELGLNYRSLDNKIVGNVNLYNTTWKNRVLTRTEFSQVEGTDDGLFTITGMDLLHQGIEFDVAYQPIKLLRIDVAASFGNWKHTNDPTSRFKEYVSDFDTTGIKVYLNNLKVGDAPQSQFALAASIFPVKGLRFQFVFRNYSNFYADWEISSRLDPDDTDQSWKTPSYYVMDLHASFEIPMKNDSYKVGVFAHVFNLLDAIYIQDATDNSKYNAYRRYNDDGDYLNNHSAATAEVYLGSPRTFNAGFYVRF